MTMTLHGSVNSVVEWGIRSGRPYRDPFNEVEVDVVVIDPDGVERRVPAYWAGGQEWRMRVAPSMPGTHRWVTVCSDPSNSSLDGIDGVIEAVPYDGSNRLIRHGRLRIQSGSRHVEHSDGTPFLWLGDTWWMSLTRRLSWPTDFQILAADRVAKGFTVAQIVAGLYPDMGAYDERGANEAGFPWEPDWARIRPSYYDMADLRFQWLVRSGIVPCIVGCWGYYVHWLGVEKMKQHWRYLVARYSAFPVVWCLCGEVTMPYYLEPLPTPEARQDYRKRTVAAWSEIGRYVRSLDSHGNPITVHPGGGESARESVDEDILDFDMLQTGHNDRRSLPGTVSQVTRSYGREPSKPVINAEPCYEGIAEGGREEVMRLLFWTCMLSGAMGHTYGANGIWQVNSREKPYGPSPHGSSWGDVPWEDAYQLPGSKQVGLGKALIARYRWWQFEPHPEWVEPRWSDQNHMLGYAAGILGQVRMLFVPSFVRVQRVQGLEAGVAYRAYYFDPKEGGEYDAGAAEPDDQGSWRPPSPPRFQDWVLVLEAENARVA
ncbi:DUF4038 domain-containing protein [Candidatus Poribacteria bacterium]|nr:DUF4038 domain-containing protein [Candidatus Poribacteria bacterium]